MNDIRKRLVLGCAAIGFSSFALLANAEGQRWGHCKDQANKEECRHTQMVKFQAAFEQKWHDKLKITPAQEPVWKAFTENFHRQGSMNDGLHKKLSQADNENLTAPQRMERYLARMEKRQAVMQKRLAALKTFYAKLTPEQQSILDKGVADFSRRHHDGQQWRHKWEKKQDQVPDKTDLMPPKQ